MKAAIYAFVIVKCVLDGVFKLARNASTGTANQPASVADTPAPPAEDKSFGATSSTAVEVAVRLAIPLGIAVIAATFVALGIEGEVFSRLIRNYPLAVALALIFAVVGVTVPLLSRGLGKDSKAVGAAGAAFLILGTGIAVVSGVIGTSIREQPTVTFEQQGAVGAEGMATYKITAGGLSLRSDGHMLLQVTAFPESMGFAAVKGRCGDTRIGLGLVGESDGSYGRVLGWQEAGPSATGTAANSISLTVDRDEFAFLCAVAVDNIARGKERVTLSLLDLRNAVATSTPAPESPTPSPTPTPSVTPSQE